MIKLHIVYMHLAKMIAMFDTSYIPDKHEIISIEQNKEVKDYYVLEKYSLFRKGETVITLLVRDN